MVCGSSFAKTICSICYEDLKPIVEDLQVISICGHVFHELCIQQWFEYCSNGKKKNCPVCKQICSEANVARLYFQSVSDPSLTQKQFTCDENPTELQREVEKLGGKVLGLTSALERQQKDARKLSEELCCIKEQAKKELVLKNEALQQKATTQQLLHLKSEELGKSTLQCTRLQEKNMALAKELAALKLASDLNLEEEEVLKLASLGNEANNKDKIDVLKKTLVIRNKSYKELMAKCNVMGRGEARSLRKLEKKKEKIKKLKMRIQELERDAEVKDNEVLRALKASKRTTREGGMPNDIECNLNSSSIKKCLNSRLDESLNLDHNGSWPNLLCSPNKIMFKPSKGMASTDPKYGTSTFDKGISCNYTIDDNASDISPAKHKVSRRGLKSHIIEDIADPRKSLPSQAATSVTKDEAIACETYDKADAFSATVDKDEVIILDDIKQVESFPRIEKKTLCPVSISQPEDLCFSGGLLAPDGTLRHLGKWCKRAQGKGSVVSSAQGPITTSGDLIAVGADGRGGRIKVLRSLNHSSESMENLASTKRCKLGAKTSSLQSQGYFQIEHFFGKAGQ